MPAGPDILDSRSHLYPDSLRTMGYDVGATGFELVLSKDVAAVVEQYIEDDVTQFLGAHGLTTTDIGAFVSHPGGPKVIEAINAALDLPPEALELTWRSLGEIGNLSSASVLHVLRDTIGKAAAQRKPRADDRDGSRILFRTRVAALALMRRLCTLRSYRKASLLGR